MSTSPSCHILVVHDDDAFRKQLVRTLDQHHFSVTFTADGIEALAYLEERVFSVVVVYVDVRGPQNLNVLEALRERRSGTGGEAVIVLAPPSEEVRELARFADETMMIPVDAEHLTARARTYCGQPQA
ncbi:MAG: response regulator [Thermoanaerobaculia bacterium]